MTVKRFGFMGSNSIFGETGAGAFVSYEDYKSLEGRLMAQSLEAVRLKEKVSPLCDADILPDFHSEGMGCGLEDRGITDRYRAMEHGWECALDRVVEGVLPCKEDIDCPVSEEELSGYVQDTLLKLLKGYDVEHAIASALADRDGMTDEELMTVIWTGYPPEPEGDVFCVEYVTRAWTVIDAIIKTLKEDK